MLGLLKIKGCLRQGYGRVISAAAVLICSTALSLRADDATPISTDPGDPTTSPTGSGGGAGAAPAQNCGNPVVVQDKKGRKGVNCAVTNPCPLGSSCGPHLHITLLPGGGVIAFPPTCECDKWFKKKNPIKVTPVSAD